jgi:peroxiredoxin
MSMKRRTITYLEITRERRSRSLLRWPTLLALLLPLGLADALFILRDRKQRLQASTATPPAQPAKGGRPLPPLRLGARTPAIAVRDDQGQLHARVGKPGAPSIAIFLPGRSRCSLFKPALVACRSIVQRYESAGVSATVITDVPPKDLNMIRQRYDLAIPVVADEGGKTAEAFHVADGDFFLFVIDQKGKLGYYQIAPVHRGESPLTRYLDYVVSRSQPALLTVR